MQILNENPPFGQVAWTRYQTQVEVLSRHL
jgi:hypothetical protein